MSRTRRAGAPIGEKRRLPGEVAEGEPFAIAGGCEIPGILGLVGHRDFLGRELRLAKKGKLLFGEL
jgi:hypothetical protein